MYRTNSLIAIALAAAAGLLTALAALAQSTRPAAAPATLPAPPETPPPPPAPAAGDPRPRVLVISVDGLRPDLLLRCRTPNIRALVESGSYSFWARTTPHSITLPSHVSMLTGVVPRKHEIEWNGDMPLSQPVYPKFPTLFGLAKRAGYTTALAAGKRKFTVLAEPGTLDWQFIPYASKCEDADVAARAAQMIHSHRPQVMAVHLPTVDNVGHAKGWGTPEQRAALEQADAHVGRLLAALSEAGVRERTFVILSADHGGAGRTHLADDPRSRYIPWVIAGPGIRQGLDLTTYAPLTIDTEDTFATACRLLDIPLDPRIDGKPVTAVLESPGELLRAE